MKKIVFLHILLLVLFGYDQAYAYLDPGAGSMLLQAIIAGVLAVTTAIGVFRQRLKKFFSRFANKKDNDGINTLQ